MRAIITRRLLVWCILLFALSSDAVPDLNRDSRQLLQTDVAEVNVAPDESLREAVENLGFGRTLHIDAESVRLTQSITIAANNITIRGRGMNRTTVYCPGETQSAVIIRGHGIRIEDLTFSGCLNKSAVVIDGRGPRRKRRGVSVSFLDVRFTQNERRDRNGAGAGLRINSCLGSVCARPEVSITRCHFEGNTACFGGAIYGRNCVLKISDSRFERNTASLSGGAVFLRGSTPVLELHSSTFNANHAANTIALKANPLIGNLSAEANTINRGGGAVFVGTPSRLRVTNCTFSENNASFGGGAIRVEIEDSEDRIGSSVNASIEETVFYMNNIERVGTANIGSQPTAMAIQDMGGALSIVSNSSVALNLSLHDSKFERNSAHGGGAAYIHTSSEVFQSIRSCSFIENEADGIGGALLIRLSFLEINGSSFIGNKARLGGGVHISRDCKVVLGPDASTKNRTLFEYNTAWDGAGLQSLLRVSVILEGVEFRHNVALRYAGAMRVYNTRLPIHVRGVLFENNTALVGGAISSHSGMELILDDYDGVPTRIIGNTAILGGGLYRQRGILNHEQMHIRNTVFRDNRASDFADPTIDWYFSNSNQDPFLRRIVDYVRKRIPVKFTTENVYKQTSDSPYGHGGGFMIETGDLNMYLIAEFVFENVSLTGNEARVGGGGSLHVSKSFWNVEKRVDCFPASYGVDSCQKLLFQNVTITDNKAEYGGGLFVTSPQSVNVTCNRNVTGASKNLLEVMLSQLQEQERSLNFEDDLLCTDIHNNTISNGALAEGANVGSSAASLYLENYTGTLKAVASGETLSLPCKNEEDPACPKTVTVTVKDAFGQTISQGTDDASLDLMLSATNIAGALRYTTTNGTVDIVNTTAWGVNAASELLIQSSENRTQPIKVMFETRACVVGESIQEHLCSPCPHGQYGFTPTNHSCKHCEDHAICQGEATLVPEDGYWHSTPFSPQFHPCFFREACTYGNRTQYLTRFYNDPETLQALLKGLNRHIDYGATMPNFCVYKQCADGYEGVLCGSCEANYGHSLNGQCSRCPAHRTVSILLGFAFFLWIFIVVGINAAMTLLSSRDRIRLVKGKLRCVAGDRRAVLRRTRAHVNRNAVREVTEQSRSISGPSSDMTDLHSRQLLQERLVATVQLTELLKILLNYLQITSAALRLHVEWNTETKLLLSVEAAFVGVASDELTAPFECLFENSNLKHPSIAAIWLRMLIPTIALFALVLVFSIVWFFIQWRHRKDQSIERDNASVTKSWKTGVIVIVIVAVSFSFIDVTRDLFRTINCVHVDESVSSDSDNPYEKYAVETGGTVWVEDTDIKCFRGKHLGTGIAGIFGLLLAFTVILSIIIRLPLNRINRRDPKFIARYWFLYQGYRMKWFTFGWEAVILTRKALIAATIVFAVHMGPNLQATLCVGILLFALMVHSICKPFVIEKEDSIIPDYFGAFFEYINLPSLALKWKEVTNSTNLNGLESASLLCSMSVFLSAAIVHDSHTSRWGMILMGTATFSVNLLYMMFMFYRLYAGLHLVLDLKLELSDTAYMALNPNGPGICCLLKKARRIFRLAYEEHMAHLPKRRENQIELQVQCTIGEARNEESDP